jgi:hypothetical protein
LSVTVGVIFSRSNTRLMRQKPTRMPYSCQLQFGWSGSMGWPCGGVIAIRAMAREMSQCSSDISGQTMSRKPSGSFSGGRPSMGENARRSCGSMGYLPERVGVEGCRATAMLSNLALSCPAKAGHPGIAEVRCRKAWPRCKFGGYWIVRCRG